MLLRVLRSVSFMSVVAVLTAIGAYQAWLALGTAGRIGQGVLEKAAAEGSIPAVVRLPFKPERFHIGKIQAAGGRIRRVNGNAVELRSITADGVKALASRYYWIERIESL